MPFSQSDRSLLLLLQGAKKRQLENVMLAYLTGAPSYSRGHVLVFLLTAAVWFRTKQLRGVLLDRFALSCMVRGLRPLVGPDWRWLGHLAAAQHAAGIPFSTVPPFSSAVMFGVISAWLWLAAFSRLWLAAFRLRLAAFISPAAVPPRAAFEEGTGLIESSL